MNDEELSAAAGAAEGAAHLIHQAWMATLQADRERHIRHAIAEMKMAAALLGHWIVEVEAAE